MNINRMARIVNKIAKKRIAMSPSPYNLDKIWRMAKEDPDSEVFLYDDVVTNAVHRASFPLGGNHMRLVRNIFSNNKEKIKELGDLVKSEYDLYQEILRGYWLPETNQIFFHEQVISGGTRYRCPDVHNEQVSKVLSEIGIELPEETYCIAGDQ